MGLQAPEDVTAMKQLIHVCDLLSRKPDLSGLNAGNKAWLQQQQDIISWLEAGRRLTAIHQAYQTS